jgi:hypothetical protein
MFAVDNIPITKPMMSIQSHSFHWKPNLEPYKTLHVHPSAHKLNLFSVVLETNHQEMSDLPALSVKLMKAFKVTGGRSPALIQATYDLENVLFLKRVLTTLANEQGKEANRVVQGLPDVQEDDIDKKVALWGDEAFELLFKVIPTTW